MAISDISLTSGMRSNLINLQATSVLLDRTQTRLSTGKKVNTALDDPVNFFAAQGLSNRASDLAALKDGMGEAIQTVKAADAGISGITSLISAAKGILQSAQSASDTDRDNLITQYNAIMGQIDDMATDSNYKGTNLLNGGTLTVNFSSTSSLDIVGFDATIAGDLALTKPVAGDWNAGTTGIQDSLDELDAALGVLRTNSASLASNLSVVTSRQEFTSNMIATLKTGADNLTLADMNEEGANMLMLQTRQSLGVTALSLSSQAAQSVLRLFG